MNQYIHKVEQMTITRSARNALVNMIPVLMIGAFSLILQTLPIPAYQRMLCLSEWIILLIIMKTIMNGTGYFGIKRDCYRDCQRSSLRRGKAVAGCTARSSLRHGSVSDGGAVQCSPRRSASGWASVLLSALLIAAALLPFGASFVYAETNAGDSIDVDVTGRKQGYSAVLYNNMNGLPTSEANAITETSEGFIWIGSYSGLIRYDGNTFERMDSTTGIASVRTLFVDSKDRLWIGTNDSGIALMEKGVLSRLDSDEDLKAAAVRSITEDKDGNIYAATTAGITIIDKDMNVRLIGDEKITGLYVTDLQNGADDRIYGTTVNGEIFTLRGGRLDKFYDAEKLGGIAAISVLPDDKHPGRVWVGTDGSEIRYGKLDKFAKAKIIDTGELINIKTIENYNDQLWICADNGIGNYENGKISRIDNVPMDHSIDHIMADYTGNLWFTSSRQGVMKIVPNRFEDYFEKYGLGSTVVNSTCLFKDRLFIGTDDGLIVTNSKGAKKSVPLGSAKTASGTDLGATDLLQMLEGVRIRSILPDSKGNIWLATFSDYGMIRFDGDNATCFTMDDGMPSAWMRATCERKDGTMLVACTGGVVVIDGNKVKRVYNDRDGLENTEILTVTEAGNGDIIAGSDGGGIYIINDEGVRNISTRDGLSSNVIMRVKKDKTRDVYWLVTSNALAYMDDTYKITVISQFPYSNNFDLYQNGSDEMWVLSSNGIYVITTEEMLAAKEISPVFYGVDNGLPAITTGNSYSALGENGDMYIACSTGVVKVNIDEQFEDVSNLKIAVPYVDADEETIFPDSKGVFTIPANTQKLTVYSFVYNYSLINPKVTYWLDGFEKGKTTVSRSELTPVDYTNLRGGTYRFVIKLSDSMGHGNNDLSVTIVKEKKFYEKKRFLILVLAVLAAVIWGSVQLFVQIKTRKYRQKEEEDRALIREITTAFAKTIDMKDKYTNGHSLRVAKYTEMLARELGYSEEEIEKYYDIALLHDIGKIGIPEEVLNKPGKLTDEEFAIIKSHPSLGYNALKDISIMPDLAIGAGSHHERPDGKGYPNGLKGEEIPRVARIIGVADCFDAMYSNRPYRNRMNFEKVVSIIREVAGTQLDPEVVDAFMRLVAKGEFRAPDDHGGGSTETIENIHNREKSGKAGDKTDKTGEGGN